MRDATIIILILLIIFVGDTIVQGYLEKSSSNIISKLENLKEKTLLAKETQDRSEIKEIIKETEEVWEKTNKGWSIVVSHQELDHIEEAMTKSKSSINDGQLEEALEELETVIFFINHVREREKVLLKNIF